MSTGIYQITNTANGKIYIGYTSTSFKRRWNEHISSLNGKNHHNVHLQRAWEKYGKEFFIFESIMEISDIEEMRKIETEMIIRHRSYDRNYGYNIAIAYNGIVSPLSEPHIAIDPDGRFIPIKNLKKFCMEYDLNYRCMRKVRDGTSSHHRFWRCYRSTNMPEYIDSVEEFREKIKLIEYNRTHHGKRAKKYVIVDPVGNEMEITNLSKWCRENDFNLTEATGCATRNDPWHVRKWRFYLYGQVILSHEVFLSQLTEKHLTANIIRRATLNRVRSLSKTKKSSLNQE